MDRDPYTVGIAPGDGLVVRTGDVVMYIADTSLSTGSLITAVESVANAEQPGGAIAERLAALAFGTDSASVAPFGVLAPTANGVLVLLRGNVIAQIDTADGVRELSGARALTWVDEVLPPSARRVTIGGRPGLVALKHSDLQAGVVPGGGFVLEPSASATQPSTGLSVGEGATILHPPAPGRPITERPRVPSYGNRPPSPTPGHLIGDRDSRTRRRRPRVGGGRHLSVGPPVCHRPRPSRRRRGAKRACLAHRGARRPACLARACLRHDRRWLGVRARRVHTRWHLHRCPRRRDLDPDQYDPNRTRARLDSAGRYADSDVPQRGSALACSVGQYAPVAGPQRRPLRCVNDDSVAYRLLRGRDVVGMVAEHRGADRPAL